MGKLNAPATPRSSAPSTPLATRRRSLVDLAHEEIHKRITDGVFKVGDRLVIDAMALEFGMSLIPVREALARLHAERLVTFEANKGYRVAPAPDPLELKQLFDARLILEIGALERGLERVTPALLQELEAINNRMAQSVHGKTFDGYFEFVMLNADFHVAIIKLSDNPYIISAYDALGYHQRIAQTLHGRGVQDLGTIVREHTEIIDALARRSVNDARDALRKHIVDASERLFAVKD